jgi:hypothetical protein
MSDMRYCSDALRSKCGDIEELLKAETAKREESLAKAESGFDAQLKTLQNQIRKEEIGRAQQELLLKSDITKLAEQLRTDYELFKSQQNQLTDKITEMIKLEVDTRMSSERENKAANETMLKKIIEDLNLFKEAVEKQNKKFAKDMKEANGENSERANFLSRYIDDQVKKVEEVVEAQITKVKHLCAKLTEQVKEHLQSNEITILELKSFVTKQTADLALDLSTTKRTLEASSEDVATHYTMKCVADEVEMKNVYQILTQLNHRMDDSFGNLAQDLGDFRADLKEQQTKCTDANALTLTRAAEDADRKVQAALERVKNENAEGWKKSLALADQQFSKEGVKGALRLAPPTVMKMGDIKSSLNDLNAVPYANPKPKLAMGPSTSKGNPDAQPSSRPGSKQPPSQRPNDPSGSRAPPSQRPNDPSSSRVPPSQRPSEDPTSRVPPSERPSEVQGSNVPPSQRPNDDPADIAASNRQVIPNEVAAAVADDPDEDAAPK